MPKRKPQKASTNQRVYAMAPIERLKAGIRKFQAEVYEEHAAAYRKAASEQQRPHTLFVACADSRIDVETITSASTGDLFITRNVGNMVPAFGDVLGGVSAVIEYAVGTLKVQHIVVCGHTDCGAMKAVLNPPPPDTMPYIAHWLTHGLAALRVAETVAKRNRRDKLAVLTEQNVLMQLAHLRTHPQVAGALAKGALTVSGWVYDIGSGSVRICEGDRTDFETIRPGDPAR